ncbi:MAG: XTP/dITP diphosphatase [Nitrospirae bacterium]|nr:XTP/dITP diphosphatase [Candidatus Manganitrophaceae bacterium]
MLLVIATENRHKGEELASILKQEIPIEVQTLADFPSVQLPPETGSTYRENAIQKAVSAARATGQWALGDDSGLEVDALDGAPGLYSARFAGEGVTYADNRRKLLEALGDLPDERRGAQFVCTIAVAGPDGTVAVVEGRCEGRITRGASGEGGFGYDPIFFLPAYNKTFAELSPEEKNRISHRGRAVRAAIPLLKKAAS